MNTEITVSPITSVSHTQPLVLGFSATIDNGLLRLQDSHVLDCTLFSNLNVLLGAIEVRPDLNKYRVFREHRMDLIKALSTLLHRAQASTEPTTAKLSKGGGTMGRSLLYKLWAQNYGTVTTINLEAIASEGRR